MKKEELAVLVFKDAQKALNNKQLETAKEKFSTVMELAKGSYPWLYFEACFGLVETYIEEENYKNAIDNAFKAILYAPNQEMYFLGLERLKSIFIIIKKNNKISSLSSNFGTVIEKKNEELYDFSRAINAIARGNYREAQSIMSSLKTNELKNIIRLLLE
ncbi:hypothetical protein EP1X_05585 [Thermococcus sp. EP1]|uniref:hypothetical protein n=1 Tax=Thermococcus sp. EP1 TaxID=1591054 RepID=UPI0006D98C96|nr:hypothetical protein [Thermococcus sp. EP1]KPU63240.1 hypothetical protein EP1X_05585 [Thermococcus sp. EP1]